VIEARDLSRSFGKRTALRGASLRVDKGEIVGLVGPNGAGKSTLLRILAGFLDPDRGTVTIGGRVGYLAETSPLPPEMRVAEYLRFRAGLKRVPRAERAAAVARGLGLEAWPRGAGPAEFSSGNPRFGDVVALAPAGTLIVGHTDSTGQAAAALAGPLRGAHGYRPELAEMTGLFAAIGRGVEPGSHPALVHAVDVAPTVLSLLGVTPPEWMEGRPVPLSAPARAESPGHPE